MTDSTSELVALRGVRLVGGLASPLGIALFEGPDFRATAFVSGDFARSVSDAIDAIGLDGMAGFEIPDEMRLRAFAPGWPDDWTTDEHKTLSMMLSDAHALGWQRFRERSDAASVLAEELDDE